MSFHVAILPQIDQAPLYNLLNFSVVGYGNAAYTNVLGAVQLPPILCPSASQINVNGYTADTTIQTTHYYGIMGPKVAPGGLYTYLCSGNSSANECTVPATAAHGGYAQNGILGRNSKNGPKDVLDGMSNTFLVGEISNVKSTSNQPMIGYRRWYRGIAGTASGGSKNVVFGINTTPYNGSNNFNDISMGSNHVGGAQFLMGDGSVKFVSQNVSLVVYLSTASMNGGEPSTVD